MTRRGILLRDEATTYVRLFHGSLDLAESDAASPSRAALHKSG